MVVFLELVEILFFQCELGHEFATCPFKFLGVVFLDTKCGAY